LGWRLAPARPAILILGTGNSRRSHIGEGFLRSTLGDLADVQSADFTSDRMADATFLGRI